MQSRQPWLCQFGSAKSPKSQPHLPAASPLPAGPQAGAGTVSIPGAAGPRGRAPRLHPASWPPSWLWGALPTPAGILSTPQAPRKPLAPLATHHGTAPAPAPRQTGASNLLLWRIRRTMSWAMPGGAWPARRGGCFLLPSTADAAVVSLGLPSSRAIRRKRRVQWRVTKLASPGAQGSRAEVERAGMG